MKESLQLDPNGEGFVLRRTDAAGNVTQIELSADNVLTLARSSQFLSDHILAKQSRSGADAVNVTEVTRIGLNHDLHSTEIHLSFFDRHGAAMTFALPPQFAQHLVDRLPDWIEKISHSPKTKQ
jgi:hypothetical protein